MRCGAGSTRRRCATSRASAGPSRRAASRPRCSATGFRSTDRCSMLRLGPERAATRAAMTSAAPQNPIAVLVEREGLGDGLLKLPLLRAIARAADGVGELEATPSAHDAARELLPEGPLYVGLGIGSRELRKNWPIAKFAELARALSARGMTPVLLLGPREIERAGEIRAAVPALASIDLTRTSAGGGSFDFSIAIAKRLAAV